MPNSATETTPVLLRGFLGARFGPRFDLKASTPAAAIKHLCAHLKGFRQAIEGHKAGFRVLVGNEAQDLDEIHNPCAGQRIRIVPVVSGASGSGFGKILIGAALLVAAYYTGGVTMSFAETYLGTAGASMVGGIGMSMVLGGVSQLLASPPNPSSYAQDSRDPSYLFSGGGTNTATQGSPVPILLGRMKVQGVLLSGGIDAEAYSATELGSTGAADGVWTGDGNTVPRVCTVRAE